jgi:hypothetical protein
MFEWPESGDKFERNVVIVLSIQDHTKPCPRNPGGIPQSLAQSCIGRLGAELSKLAKSQLVGPVSH